MKKFISFALTAAMVASLVPATAFAKTQDGDIYHGTVSVVNAWNDNKKFTGDVNKTPSAPNYNEKNTPEAQIRVTDVDYRGTDAEKIARFTIRLDNANFFTKAELTDAMREKFNDGIKVTLNPNGVTGDSSVSAATYAWYEEVSDNTWNTMLKDYYNAVVAGGDYAAFNKKYEDKYIVVNTDKDSVYYTTKDDAITNTAAPLTLDTTVATTKKVKVTGALMNSEMDATSASANDTTKPTKTVTETRDALLTEYVKTGEPGNGILTAGKETWVNNTPFDAGAGWVDSDATDDPTKFISEADVVAWALANPTKVNDTATSFGYDIKEGVGISDGKIVGITGAFKDFDTWKSGLTLATDRYIVEENTTKVGVDRPTYGMAREGIVAEIENLKDMRENEITVTVYNEYADVDSSHAKYAHRNDFLEKGDIISVDLVSILKNSSQAAGFSVTSSDFRLTNDNADFTYVNVDKEALVLSARKVVDVAEDEVVTLDDKGLVIKTNVGTFRTGADNQVNLKISKGFEFVTNAIENRDGGNDWDIVARLDGDIVANAVSIDWDTDKTNKEEITLTINKDVNEITIYGIDVKAASAKISKVATIKATSNGFNASAAVEVAKVVDYIVMLSVDEDEDVPVIYSGVDVNNTGLTDDSDHWSLEVTAEESFPGAWSFRKGFNFELPEHVFVADVEVISTENFLKTRSTADKEANEVDNDEVFDAFFNAYQNGSHVNFEFDKRVFDDVDAKLTEEPASMTFKLQLVADTGFEGDVALKLTGELVDEQEVTIAKFVKPYEVKAEQNDIIIDYRYTDIPTAITITEAEGGLWDKDNATFRFKLENHEHNFFEFEGDPTFEVDSKSDMSLKSAKVNDEGMIQFTVDSESDEAATIEIKGMQLFMNRSIPAGPYDLLIESSLDDAYHEQMLFAPDAIESLAGPNYENSYRTQVKNVGAYTGTGAAKEDSYVGHVEDCTTTVKEAFVNVVTAGRDQDDASFTTKVVVPVGEDHIFAGEKEIKLDTPAYINEAGYTMLPIRAVAVALGINSNNVLWDQPTKTVTILYGQRIITMTQGQKVVYVNGSAIPASAAVENTNSRTFLPMRDLATALGVTDITWDQASRTATLNGNQK